MADTQSHYANNTRTVVREAAILTGSYVAGTVINNSSLEFNELILYVDFTIGSLTTADIKIEFSDNNSDYYQYSVDSVTTSTTVSTANINTLDATAKLVIPIPVKYRYIKISSKGTGTVTGSSLKITAVLANS